MMNEDLLHAGQVVKIMNVLYRVEYVNECRARLTPITKRMVDDGEEYARAINISPRSPVEVITNVDLARAEIERDHAKAQLRAAEAEYAQQQTARQQAIAEHAAAKAELEQAEAEYAAYLATKPSTPTTTAPGRVWFIGDVPMTFKPGTLSARIIAYVREHPGQTTKQIVAGLSPEKGVAAFLSRFFSTGHLKRS